jgi:PKD repeat protein
MKKLIFLLFCSALLKPASAQPFIAVLGTVTDIQTGNPVSSHQVLIQTDSSSGFSYARTVYTNNNGNYIDSIFFPGGIVTSGHVIISTLDCNQSVHSATGAFGPGNLQIVQNFQICAPPCLADFTAVPDNSNPLLIHFTDLSTGNITNWSWDFGDGSYSTLQNPSHQYAQTGHYGVYLYVQGADSSCYAYHSDTLIVGNTAGCQADFIALPDSSNPLLIHFTDQSTGNIISWSWSFGDGSYSSQQNPSHQYAQAGHYGVGLQVQGADSSCYSYHFDTLVVGNSAGCQANFYWSQDSLQGGNTVHFHDWSTGQTVAWYWTFGDGGTSTQQNPVHIYPQPGNYTACLTITAINPDCTSTWCTTVNFNTSCESYFTYSANWLDVMFEGHKVNGMPASYSWDFGDGGSGTGMNISHSYTTPGYHTVTLTTVEDSTQCAFTYTGTILIGDTSNIHQVYGQVLAGNFPLSQGFAMIFSLDTSSNPLPYFAVSYIDSSGVYYFPYVPDGNYVVWAFPFDSTGGYLPTFYGDVIYWEQATVITLGNPQNPYDIHLVHATQAMNGPGGINGQINTRGMKSTSLDKITMLLMNEQGQAIGYRKVNTSGSFDFSTLAYGTYYLKAELPACNSDVVKVVISASNPVPTVIMTFSGTEILGVNEKADAVESAVLYPNPVRDVLNISLKVTTGTTVSAQVYNLGGQLVAGGTYNLSGGENKVALELSNLSPGMYTLHLSSANGINLNRKLIITR